MDPRPLDVILLDWKMVWLRRCYRRRIMRMRLKRYHKLKNSKKS